MWITVERLSIMENDKKLGKQIDRLVMGIILGGAIGSVIGLTFAPRKGKETREIIKKKGEEFVRDHRETIEGAKYQLKKGGGFLRWFLRRKMDNEPMPKKTIDEETKD